MAVGADGVVNIDTASVLAVLLPHTLFAVTLIVPPEVPEVAVILLVVDEPLHPLGKVQL